MSFNPPNYYRIKGVKKSISAWDSSESLEEFIYTLEKNEKAYRVKNWKEVITYFLDCSICSERHIKYHGPKKFKKMWFIPHLPDELPGKKIKITNEKYNETIENPDGGTFDVHWSYEIYDISKYRIFDFYIENGGWDRSAVVWKRT